MLAGMRLLQVDSKNFGAIALYEGMGFTFHHAYRYMAHPEIKGEQSC
jgi:ribosomal protein S18 acetylase RimI-like enzyme